MIHIKKKGGAIFVFWEAEGKACWGCQSWGQKVFQYFLGGGKQGRGYCEQIHGSAEGSDPIDAMHCGGGGLRTLFQSTTAHLWTGGQRDPWVFGWGRHRGSRRTQWPLGFYPSPASPLKCHLGP